MYKAARQEHVAWPAYNPAVGATLCTVWGQGATRFNYNVMPGVGAGQGIRVVSDSANDAAAGSGANTILVYGVRVGEIETQELIALNGLTPVVSAYTDWLWIEQVMVVTAGNGANIQAVNAGKITIAVNGGANDGVPVCGMAPETNRSTKGTFRVPYNRYVFLETMDGGVLANNGRVTVDLRVQETPNGVFYKRVSMEVTNQESEVKLHIMIKPRCCFEITGKTVSGTQAVLVNTNMYFYTENQLEKLGLA